MQSIGNGGLSHVFHGDSKSNGVFSIGGRQARVEVSSYCQNCVPLSNHKYQCRGHRLDTAAPSATNSNISAPIGIFYDVDLYPDYDPELEAETAKKRKVDCLDDDAPTVRKVVPASKENTSAAPTFTAYHGDVCHRFEVRSESEVPIDSDTEPVSGPETFCTNHVAVGADTYVCLGHSLRSLPNAARWGNAGCRPLNLIVGELKEQRAPTALLPRPTMPAGIHPQPSDGPTPSPEFPFGPPRAKTSETPNPFPFQSRVAPTPPLSSPAASIFQFSGDSSRLPNRPPSCLPSTVANVQPTSSMVNVSTVSLPAVPDSLPTLSPFTFSAAPAAPLPAPAAKSPTASPGLNLSSIFANQTAPQNDDVAR